MITEIDGEILWNKFENVSENRNNVYRISDGLVAKFCNRTYVPLEIEYKKQKAIHLAGISSPKPRGIFDLSFSQTIHGRVEGEFYPALVMEYISGEIVNSLRGEGRYDLALGKISLEQSKAKNLGFGPKDSSSINAIWNGKKGVYLIDFEVWEVPKI